MCFYTLHGDGGEITGITTRGRILIANVTSAKPAASAIELASRWTTSL